MKKNKISKIYLSLVLLLVPFVTHAQFGGIKTYIREFSGFINNIIRIIFGLAFIFFFWGMAKFILNAGNEKAREEGKQRMIWGVIAIFVMLSIYGIVTWIGGILGIGTGSNPSVSTSEIYIIEGLCYEPSGSQVPCP